MVLRRFNSSVGILFIQAPSPHFGSGILPAFQFLSRNSLHSSLETVRRAARASTGFNSSVGILFIQAEQAQTWKALLKQFQFLSRNSLHSSGKNPSLGFPFVSCFNSSVGILFIQALAPVLLPSPKSSVSIPQSEFSSFKRRDQRGVRSAGAVSIPQSEFSSFKRRRIAIRNSGDRGFNSSVGILFIQALQSNYLCHQPIAVSIPQSEFSSFKPGANGSDSGARFTFQFLSRNSLHSSGLGGPGQAPRCQVSIPQSEFSSFKRAILLVGIRGRTSFNSSVGILFIQAKLEDR